EASAGGQEAPLPATGRKKSKKGAALDKNGILPLVAAGVMTAQQRRRQRRDARRRKRKKLEASFKDYFDFRERLNRIPPHRVLAINRGERTRVLRVKIEYDAEAMHVKGGETLISADHPHASFLQECLRDAMQRSVLPSIERDIRRELTERAEGHALDVFARNLRQLLMQPPVARRVLAVDPGIRSGCKVVALDEFGHVLEHSLITILGDDQRKEHSCKKVAEIIRRNELPVVAIGNGTGCREAEQLIADMITEHFADSDLAYVIVNEAGASVYSTSVLAGEELPEYDATLRGAISIGRRLQDPLSELVKIEPSNIGVGLYQHDVKSKPLRQSLDDVVQSCVNYVGVNVNSASPALLAYVSGLNQLTARRVYDHRRTHGPFKTREELKAVPGIGDAVFQQAAGFLKINSGENPLDATWIHPESYEVAKSALDYLDLTIQDFARTIPEAVDVAHSRPAIALQRTKEQFAAGLDRAADTCSNCGGAQQEAATTGEIAATTEIAATAVTETDELVTDAPVTDAPVSDAAESDGESISTGSDSVVSSGELTTGSSAVLGETPVETTTGVAPSVSDAGNAEVGTLREEIASKVRNVDVAEVAEKLSVGKHLLEDILSNLARPGRDPREDLRPPVFRRGIMKLEDLKPGMELTGTVLNVVDFGAFVDIGLSDSGLVHISCLADRYIRDPHEVVGVGDVLRVWVLEVDRDRRRVSLTAIEPGTERPKAERLAEQQQAERSGAGRPRGGRRRPQQGEQTGAAAGGQGRGQGQGGQGRGGQGRSGQGRSGQGRGGQGRSSHGGRPGGAARGGTKVQGKRPPKKVKPVAPITEAMREGREPMRAFSDLLQFYEQSQTTPSVDPSTETPSESPGEETGNE
ncbi:MAG: helix-hairpin-helix domain-containing protein, partial [Planctomycetales bacterium]|nr:helix-hairpin-helix domain-containing protein [Planctomycetales bacterium]